MVTARKVLPVLDSRFTSLQAHERDLMLEIDGMTLEQLCKFPLLSSNAKTSLSLDFPIGHTCAPTALCSKVCYASRPGTPARWDKSLRMRLRTLRYFQLATPRAAANRLWHEFSRRRTTAKWVSRGVRIDFLRVNGTGDLTPAVVAALNLFMVDHSEVALWVVSRRPLIAAGLEPRPNLFLQLSVDATTTQQGGYLTRELVRTNPRAYVSFLRTKVADDVSGAAIVFNEKQTSGLPYDGIADCPVDAGRLELGNVRGVGGTACSKCRKCFSPKTLERQRAAL
jgi:hypothetical protein